MAGLTGSGNACGSMVRVVGLVISIDVTGGTCRGCSAESIGMTGAAENRRMCAGQREPGIIMIEGSVYTACRVTRIAGKAVILITSDSLVSVIHFRLVVMSMTINAAESIIICWVRMTIRAKGPGTLVFPGIDREVFSVVIKRCRRPGSSGVTGLTIGTELG